MIVHEVLATLANFQNQPVDGVPVHVGQTLARSNAGAFQEHIDNQHGLIHVNTHVSEWLGLFFNEPLYAILALETLGSIGVLASFFEVLVVAFW